MGYRLLPVQLYAGVLGAEPMEVFGWQVTGASGVDELFAAQSRFPGEIFVHLDCSMRVPDHVFMELIGDKATFIIPHPYIPGPPRYT